MVRRPGTRQASGARRTWPAVTSLLFLALSLPQPGLAQDALPDGRLVDLDDSILSIMVKKNFTLGRLDAYGGLGPGGHFISARFHELEAETEKRNGFRLGLEGILGLEFPVVDQGFVSLFAEGQGSLVSELSQLSLQAGVRIRFDRLGTGG